MHNLAIALRGKGYTITGSDDEIFEPSLGRLKTHGLLPESIGWYPERVTPNLDAVVLGMHARANNPELLRAKELGIRIYSYPEYLYEQTKGKTRVVIGGSHGKTTITSMVMHVLRVVGEDFDYMVGAQLDGFDTMVRLSDSATIAVFEGDEYLTSPIDPRPKFLLYRPNIALLSGIAWDHINAFPTYNNYREQFSKFVQTIEPNGVLVYCHDDPEVTTLSRQVASGVSTLAYTTHPHYVDEGKTFLLGGEDVVPVRVIGTHNMQNIAGAQAVCQCLGVDEREFYNAIQSFSGASRRLQVLAQNGLTTVYYDFAHSPSKVKATVDALKEVYPQRRLVACLELHTFSSLNPQFMGQYDGSLANSNEAIVFYNPKTLEHKGLSPLNEGMVRDSFRMPGLRVICSSTELIGVLRAMDWVNATLLIMTSGNISGVNLDELAHAIAPQ